MKLVVALALAPVASALVAPSAPAASKTVLADAKSDLVDLQNSIPGPPGFYDPLGLSDMSLALGMQGNADGGVGLTQRLFPNFSELQARVDGVVTMPRRLDVVDAAA